MISTLPSLENPIDFNQLTAIELKEFGTFYHSVEVLIKRSGLDALKQLSASYLKMKQQKGLKEVQIENLLKGTNEMEDDRWILEQGVLDIAKKRLVEISQCLQRGERAKDLGENSPLSNHFDQQSLKVS